MEEIPISKFKATCLAVLEKVRQSGKPVLVTRFGQPVADNSAASCSAACTSLRNRHRISRDPRRYSRFHQEMNPIGRPLKIRGLNK